MGSSIIRADITYAYAVYAYLDIGYAPELPQRRVKITKDAAYEMLRDAPWMKGKFFDGDALLLLPGNSEDEGSQPTVSLTGKASEAQPTEPNHLSPQGPEPPQSNSDAESGL